MGWADGGRGGGGWEGGGGGGGWGGGGGGGGGGGWGGGKGGIVDGMIVRRWAEAGTWKRWEGGGGSVLDPEGGVRELVRGVGC